jgi:hypothetical protein
VEDYDRIYLSEDTENIQINDGVQGRYKGRILNYFNKTEKPIYNRKIWGKI